MAFLSSLRRPFTALHNYISPDFETSIIREYKRPVPGLRLCGKCRALKYRRSKVRAVSHYPDNAHLSWSAARGCWLCQAVDQQLAVALQDSTHPSIWTDPHELRQGRNTDLLLWFANNTVTASGYLDDLKGSNYYQYLYGPRLRPLQEDPACEAAFEIVHGWLKLCNTEHHCYQKQHESPTRLIDVSGLNPRLVIGDITEPYVTLSHCWGTAQPLITTQENLSCKLEGIPFSSLPRLFQDAVFVTKNLGIKYLWIDSLCIVQNSEEDWVREASRMGDVYRHAYLTIFALDAVDCHQGILGQRRWSSGKMGLEEIESLMKEDKSAIFTQSTLCHRAWALQERLLSPRILFYSKSEIFWECLACTAREGSSRIKPYRPSEYSYTSYECPDVKNCLILPQGRSPSMPLSPPSDWYIIVVEYTRCYLTKPTDKLPAIAGLAAIFRANTGYNYVAGLWQEDFRDGLLWYIDHNQNQARHLKAETESPSWSWISSCFPVLYVTVTNSRTTARYSPHRDIKLIGREISPKDTNNILGEVINDSITVEADFEVLHLSNDASEFSILDSTGTKVSMFLDDLMVTYPTGTPCRGLYISIRDICTADHTRAMDKLAFAGASWVYFLVIVPDPNRIGCWSRIGLGRSPEVQGLFKENSERMPFELV